jgi:hypothetical protein
MRISWTAAAWLAAALVLAFPRAAAAQDAPAPRTRIDIIPQLGYAGLLEHGRSGLASSLRLAIGTGRVGIAYTQGYWVGSVHCPADVCNDLESYTVGGEARIAERGGTVLVAGADAGVMSFYGSHAMGDVRLAVDQGGRTLALRSELQAQAASGVEVAHVLLSVGLRISFAGPRLPRR